ncbi:MAG: spore maturation protein [Clostridia bacterium]
MNYILNLIIPLFVLYIIIYSEKEKNNTFELFTSGIKEGLKTVYKILPSMMATLIVINLFNQSGALAIIFSPVIKIVKNIIPIDLIPLIIMKPFSGSGSTSIVMDIFQNKGPDSLEGIMASIIMSITETTFYTISVYYSVTNVKNIRGTLKVAIIVNIIAITLAIILIKTQIFIKI